MADLEPYRFEPERVPNAEDRESENEEVTDRLESTFWCNCERCETIPTQRECVRKQKIMEGIITCAQAIGRGRKS